MEGLVTESFHEPRKAGLKNMSADNNALASEMDYSSVIRSPVWPGAIVESNGSHLTPKTSRLKVEPCSSRRTPYSSSIFSKSKVCSFLHLYTIGLLNLVFKTKSPILLSVSSFKMVENIKGLKLFHHLGGRNLLLLFVASQ